MHESTKMVPLLQHNSTSVSKNQQTENWAETILHFTTHQLGQRQFLASGDGPQNKYLKLFFLSELYY